MNVNLYTNIIALLILVLSIVYVFLAFPSVDFFELVIAFFLSLSNFLTGKEAKKNEYF